MHKLFGLIYQHQMFYKTHINFLQVIDSGDIISTTSILAYAKKWFQNLQSSSKSSRTKGLKPRNIC